MNVWISETCATEWRVRIKFDDEKMMVKDFSVVEEQSLNILLRKRIAKVKEKQKERKERALGRGTLILGSQLRA